jgi:hypothetical protein
MIHVSLFLDQKIISADCTISHLPLLVCSPQKQTKQKYIKYTKDSEDKKMYECRLPVLVCGLVKKFRSEVFK